VRSAPRSEPRTEPAAADAAPVDQPAKLDESKPEKPRVAKKKSARSVTTAEVFEGPDGREMVVRRPSRTESERLDSRLGRSDGRSADGANFERSDSRPRIDSRRADGADFERWDNFTNAPRPGRRVQIAPPWGFESPF